MERAIDQLENALEKFKEERPNDVEGDNPIGYVIEAYDQAIAKLDAVLGDLYEKVF